MTTGRQRYIERYRADHASGDRSAESAGVTRRRLVGLVLAFAPMAVAALFPLTAVVAVVMSVLANTVGNWAAVASFVVIFVATGWLVARVAIAYGGGQRSSRWWVWAPVVVTVLVVGAVVAEIGSGSKAPDPVLGLWFVALGWVFVFSPLATERWSPAVHACWYAAPVAVLVLIPFVATDGYFSIRFGRAVDDLEAYVAELDAGSPFEPGREVGGFTVDFRAEYPGCDEAFHISGWHQQDSRWIAYCPAGRPGGDVDHLRGAWYEFERH